MAPRGRRKKPGLMREDAAKDAMRNFGFPERVISASIKELLELYSVEGWRLIEENSYDVLLSKCLEKQEEQEKKSAEEQRNVIAEEEQEQIAQEEEEEELEQEQEQEQPVEDGRDHVGSNSTTTVVGCGTVTETQTCPTDAISTTTEAAAMDSSPPAFRSGEAFEGYAHHFVGGSGGWLSEEDTDPDEDLDGDDDDDEMIQLTPEPLSEELEELVREVRGQKKRKRPSRWDVES